MVMLLTTEIQIYVYKNVHSNLNLHGLKLEPPKCSSTEEGLNHSTCTCTYMEHYTARKKKTTARCNNMDESHE